MAKRARVWTGTAYEDIVGPAGAVIFQANAPTDPSNGAIWVESDVALPLAVQVSRATATYTTASLANNAEETGTVTLAKAYRVLKLQADRACRVRVYDTVAHRTADAARAVGTKPTGDHGLMLEYVFTAAGTVALSPTVDGFSGESTPVATIPVAIQNTSGSTSTVAVTFTYLQTEA